MPAIDRSAVSPTRYPGTMARKTDGTATGRVQPGVRRKRRWLWRTVVVLLGLALLAGLGPMVFVNLFSASRLKSLDEAEARDVTIVYGAGLRDGRPSPYLAARLAVARDLYQAGKTKVILVSGDNLSDYHNEPEAMMTWLIEQGVPADKIVTDHAGQDTYSTCVRAKQVFGVDSAILVSQTYHLPRAIATCQLVGLDVIGVGDQTMQDIYPKLWFEYQLREVLADINMVYEVVTQRQPILGPHEPGVDIALGR